VARFFSSSIIAGDFEGGGHPTLKTIMCVLSAQPIIEKEIPRVKLIRTINPPEKTP
jgi:hypothetical protein